MSFRELRNFAEIMRTLGFSRPVSMENFRTPNFPLVATCLSWLINKYDPSLDIPVEIEEEEERVMFIRNCSHVMMTKAHIRLNPKKLYQADGYAVKELLKIANVLKQAQLGQTSKVGADSLPDADTRGIDMKKVRTLASELTKRGVELSRHLDKELQLREERQRVTSRPFELDEMESVLRSKIEETKEELETMKNRIENQGSDEANLKQKIEKKKAELERGKKSLKRYQNVRPGFMDEYEKLEKELQVLYPQYADLFRTLSYLEAEKQKYDQQEEERMQDAERKLQHLRAKLRDQERKLAEGDTLAEDEMEEAMNTAPSARLTEQVRRSEQNRPHARGGTTNARPSKPEGREAGIISGDIFGGGAEDSEDSEELSFSDSSGEGVVERSSGSGESFFQDQDDESLDFDADQFF